MSEHILSISYGKDSLACLGAIEALGWPLDRIVHAEVWATDTIPADLPPIYGFLTRGCPRACDFCIVAAKEGRRSVKVADLHEFWRGQKNIVLMDPNILACREHTDLLRQLIDSGAYVDFNQGLDIRMTTPENIALLNQVKVKNIHFAWDRPTDDLKPYFERYKEHATHKIHGKWGTVYILTNHGSTIEQDLHRIYTVRDMGFNPYVMVYDKPNAPAIIKRLQRWVNNKKIFGLCRKFEDYQ